ncbi:NPCBM/NEW2 domain-containing protein [Lentzea sp. CA-135723]|uniref:NPCBM/NEW2 domain-containing protein n=1 Tax=Lentzea sp. CA-135723 TaxID=3239950 RepID=UPI003D92D359
MRKGLAIKTKPDTRTGGHWKWISAALGVALAGGTAVFLSELRDSGEQAAADTPPASAPTSTTSGEEWFDLTAHEPVESGEGQEVAQAITIGKESYPRGLRGTGVAPANYRSWLIKNRCSRLSVWVGKDAASDGEGSGQFVIKTDGVEIATRQAGAGDAPQHVEIALADVDLLTLQDVRGARDADNAWGTPRVYCAAAPGAPVTR